MKQPKYREIQAQLRDSWFAPDPSARERLKTELGIEPSAGTTGAEQRFSVIFRCALAAAAVLVCAANAGSVRAEYLNRYEAPAVASWATELEPFAAPEEEE